MLWTSRQAINAPIFPTPERVARPSTPAAARSPVAVSMLMIPCGTIAGFAEKRGSNLRLI